MIAGPRVLEHMVDTVLYFEGERGHQFRILRAVKNRFGADRRDRRLRDDRPRAASRCQPVGAVPAPSARGEVSGARGLRRHRGHAAGAGRDPGAGRALAARHAAPRGRRLGRAPTRHDAWRCSTRAAASSIGANDIYLNVAGGLRIVEPAADLAVAAALVSALTEPPVPADTVVFGEIGLSGEVRPVGQRDARLQGGGQARLHAARWCRGRAASAAAAPSRRHRC